MLRHTVATLAYRAAKVLRGAPLGFENFRAAPTTRTAGEILAHMGDLIEWAQTAADGEAVWRPVPPAGWDADVARFFKALADLDARMDDPAERALLLDVLRAVESVPSLLGVRPHLLATAEKHELRMRS